jgi:FixJ family two-component response regulator
VFLGRIAARLPRAGASPVSKPHAPWVVIVVEDDADMRQAMRRVLQGEGFMTETFPSAEMFLASGPPSRARCLVLDIQLPGMSGLELHERLRSSGESIPTLFVTAHEGLCAKAMAAPGVSGCLVKPFAAEALAGTVMQVTGGLT